MRHFLFGLVLLLAPCAAQAHPHAFIDLQTTLIYNPAGQLTALREHWLFDQYYTEFALHDFAYNKDGTLDRTKLLALATENLKNLKEFDYFTSFADPKIKLGTAADIDSKLEGKQIAMLFTVSLLTPIDPKRQPVGFKIYDPSYYTAMLHQKDGNVTQQGAPVGCKAQLSKPNPNAVWVNLAAALDRNAKAPDNLGIYFAETVTVACQK